MRKQNFTNNQKNNRGIQNNNRDDGERNRNTKQNYNTNMNKKNYPNRGVNDFEDNTPNSHSTNSNYQEKPKKNYNKNANQERGPPRENNFGYNYQNNDSYKQGDYDYDSKFSQENQGRENNYSNYRGKNQQNKSSNYRGFENKKPYGNYGNHQADDYGDLRSKPNTFSKIPENNNMRYSVKDTFQENKVGNVNELVNEQETKISGKNLIDKFNNFKKPFNSVANKQLTSTPNENTITNTNPNYELNNNNNNNDNQNNNNNNNNQNNNNNNNNYENREYEEKGEDIPQSVINNRKKDVKQYDPSVEVIKIHPKNQSYQNQNKPNSIKPPYVSKPDNMNNRAPYQNQSNNRFTSNNNYNGRGRGQNKRQPYNDRNMIKSKPGKSNNDFSDSKDNESSEDYDQQNKGGYNQNSQNKFNQNQKGKFQNSHNIRNFQKNPHKQEKPVYQGKRKPNNDDDTSESEEISNNNKYQNKNKNPNQNFKQGNSHVQSQGKQGQVNYNNKNTGGGIKNSNPFFTNSMGKVSNNNYNNNNNNNKMHNKQKEPSSEEEENEEEEEEEEEEDSDNEDKNEGESKENSDSESEGKENNTGNKITNPQLGVNQMNMNPLSQGQFFNPNQNFIPQPMQIGVTDPNIIREKLQELGIHPSQINSIHPQVLNNLLYQAQLKSLGMNQNNPMLLQQQMQMQNVQSMQNQPKLNPQLQQVVPQMGGNYPLLINNNNFPGVMRYPQVQNPQMMGQQVRMNYMQPPMNFQQLNKGQFPLQQQTNNVNMNMNMINQLNRQGNFNPLTNTNSNLNPNLNQNVQLNNQQQGQLQGQGQGQGQIGNPNLQMQNSNLNNFDKKEIKNETNLNNNNNNKNESTEKFEMNNLNSLNNPMLQQQNRFANQYPNPNLQGQQNFPYPNSTDPRLLGQNNNQLNNQGQNNFMQPYPNSMIQNNQQNSNINNNNLNFGGKPDLTPKQHEKSKDVNESSNFSDAEDESLTNLKNKHLGGLGKDKHVDDKAKDDLIEISNLTSDKNSEEKEDSNNELEEVSANLNNNTGTGMNTNNVFNQGIQQNTTPGVGLNQLNPQMQLNPLNQLNPQMQLQGNFQQISNSIQQQNSNNTIMPHLKPEIIKFLHPQQINQLNQLFQLNPLMYNQHMNKLLLLLGINPEIISQQSQPPSQQVNPNLAQQQFENNFKNMSSSVDPMNNQVKSQQNNLNQFNQVSQVQMQSKQDNKSDNTSSIKETGQSFNQGNPYQQMQQNSNLNTNLNQQPNINIPSNSNLSNSSVMNTNISNPELNFPQQQQFNTNQPFPKQQIPIGNNVIVQQDPRLLPNMYQPRPYGNNYNNNIIILGNNLNNVIPSLVPQTNQINTPQTNDRGDLNLNSINSSQQNNFSNNMNRFPNTNTLTGTGTGVGNVGNNVQFNPLENERVSQNNSKTQVIPSNFNNNPIPNFKNLSLTPNQQMFQGQINPNFGLQGQGQGQGQNNPMIKQNPNLMHNPYGLQQNYNQNLMSSNISDIEKTNQNNFASEVEEDNEQKEKQDVEADEDSDSLSLENKEYKLPKNENFSSLPQRFQQAQYNLLNQQNLFAFNNNLNDPNSLFKELNKNSINPNLQAVCDNERDFNQNLLNNTNTQSQTQQVTYPRSKLDPNAKECIPKSRIVNLKD